MIALVEIVSMFGWYSTPIVWILCAFDAKLEALGGLWKFWRTSTIGCLGGEVEALWGTLGHFGGKISLAYLLFTLDR
jgi:hypothetical protein